MRERATALSVLRVFGQDCRYLLPLHLGQFCLGEMRFPVTLPNALVTVCSRCRFFRFTPGQVMLLDEVRKADVAGNVFALGVDFFKRALYQRLNITS